MFPFFYSFSLFPKKARKEKKERKERESKEKEKEKREREEGKRRKKEKKTQKGFSKRIFLSACLSFAKPLPRKNPPKTLKNTFFLCNRSFSLLGFSLSLLQDSKETKTNKQNILKNITKKRNPTPKN